MEKNTYREVMSCMAAAVNVITSDGVGGLAGCTVSAVCSVTDDPPMLLVCINRSSSNNQIIRENGKLCVNVLSSEQVEIANRFSQKGLSVTERLAASEWSILETGAPALDGAVCSLDCEIASTQEIGTHTVFFCAVRAVRKQDGTDGLIYFGRNFHHVAASSNHAVTA